MSLTIHTIVRDGLVVSEDTRTTYGTPPGRYSNNIDKIIPFSDDIVISYIGNVRVTKKISVCKFLMDSRKEFGNNINITDLPLKLLNRFFSEIDNTCKRDRYKNTPECKFYISGYHKTTDKWMTYYVNTENKTILFNNYGSGFVCGGADKGEDIVKSMMDENYIQYFNLSIPEAIDLSRESISAAITSYKYREETFPSVGGDIKTYVINTLKEEQGWYEDGEIIPDKYITGIKTQKGER